MAIPTMPGASFPADGTIASAQTFLAAQLDIAVTSGGATVLAYALPGSINVFINNLPVPWNYSGPMVATPTLYSQLVNSGVRFSNGFTTTLLP